MFSFTNTSRFRRYRVHVLVLLGFLLALAVGSILLMPAGEVLADAADDAMVGTIPAMESLGEVDVNMSPDFGCSFKNMWGCVASALFYVFLIPMYWLALGVGIVFNFIFIYFVMSIGNVVDSMAGINTAWVALRDLANIFLVFLTVFIGIATILNVQSYGYKQLLWKVILAALFVNFSGLLVAVVVDAANIVSVAIFEEFIWAAADESIVDFTCLEAVEWGALSLDSPCLTVGLPGIWYSKLRLTSVLSGNRIREATSATNDDLMMYVSLTIMSGALLLLVLAYVMAVAAFLLLARFIMIIVLLILSPIALVVWITGVSNQGRMWWNQLINQAITAPALLLMWYISYLVLDEFLEAVLGGSQLADAIVTGYSGFAILTTFVVAAGFLILSVILAKKLGAWGAGAAIAGANKMTRTVTGAYAGGAAFAARNTVGRGARRIAESERVKNMVGNENSKIARYTGRAVRSSSNVVAGQSFDARGLAGKDMQKFTGTQTKRTKGGFIAQEKREKERIKEEDKYLRENPQLTAAEAVDQSTERREVKKDIEDFDNPKGEDGESRERVLAKKQRAVEELEKPQKEMEAQKVQLAAEQQQADARSQEIEKEMSEKEAAVEAKKAEMKESGGDMKAFQKQQKELADLEKEQANLVTEQAQVHQVQADSTAQLQQVEQQLKEAQAANKQPLEAAREDLAAYERVNDADVKQEELREKYEADIKSGALQKNTPEDTRRDREVLAAANAAKEAAVALKQNQQRQLNTIDRKYYKGAEDRANARADANLDYRAHETYLGGTFSSAQHKRDMAQNLRKNMQKDKKRVKEIENILKANDEAQGGSSPKKNEAQSTDEPEAV